MNKSLTANNAVLARTTASGSVNSYSPCISLVKAEAGGLHDDE
jgi:hypothetical protein